MNSKPKGDLPLEDDAPERTVSAYIFHGITLTHDAHQDFITVHCTHCDNFKKTWVGISTYGLRARDLAEKHMREAHPETQD